MINKIFVTNFSGHPYEKAKNFGELVFMTMGFIHLQELGEVRDKLKAFIDTSDPSDYIIFSGNNTVCVLAGILWKEKHGHLNVLQWDGRKEEYKHYVI